MALTPDILFAIATLVITAVAAFTDTRHGLIPNWLTLPALLVAPLAHLLVDGPGGFGLSLLSALICGLVPIFLFVKGAMGGGDVKLFSAIGALLPIDLALGIQLQAYLCVAFIALLMLTLRGQLLRVLLSTYRLATPWKKRAAPPAPAEAALHSVRMGLGIFVAAILTVSQDWLL